MFNKQESQLRGSKFPSAPRQERMPRVLTEGAREPGTQKEHFANLPCTD